MSQDDNFFDLISASVPDRKQRQPRAQQSAKKFQRKSTNTNSETLAAVRGAGGCGCNCYEISQADLPFQALVPGCYKVVEDLNFAPVEEAVAAITVLSDNVTIDLCQHTLKHDNSVYSYGIQLGEGYDASDPDNSVNNVTVQNGTIRDFTGIGIFGYNASFDGPTAEKAWENLQFLNLNVLHCSTYDDYGSGINLDSAADSAQISPVAYRNVIIRDSHIDFCSGAPSVNVYTVDSITIEKSAMNDHLTSENFFSTISAALYIEGLNIVIRNSQFNRSRNTDIVKRRLHQVDAAYLAHCTNVVLQDSQFNDCFGEAVGFVIGINLGFNKNVQASGCQFNNARGGPSVEQIICGVEFAAGRNDGIFQAENNKFTNCQFNGAGVADDNAAAVGDFAFVAGLLTVVGTNLIIENCQAAKIRALAPQWTAAGLWLACWPQFSGFPFDNCESVSVTGTVVSDIEGSERAVGVYFVGIPVSASTFPEQSLYKNLLVKNCVVHRVRGSAPLLPDRGPVVCGVGSGFRRSSAAVASYPLIQNFSVQSTTVSDVHNTDSSIVDGVGILAESVIFPIFQGNTVSDCDRGIQLRGVDPVTVQIPPPVYTERGVIESNSVSNNLVAGIEDTSLPCTTSTFISNKAYCNGANGKGNYFISWGGKAPVAKGNLSRYPRPKYYTDNVSIECGRCDCVKSRQA